MKIIRSSNKHANFIITAILLTLSSVAIAEEDWWQEARKANCAELIDAYKSTKAAEQKAVSAINASNGGTIAANVVGITSLAILGVGFFTWDDNATAEENLADIREDINIITTVSAEKKCKLPR